MQEAKFMRKRYGHKFAVEILDPGEAEQNRLATQPVRCLKCSVPLSKAKGGFYF